MRAFDLGQTFNLITIPFRPFQHLIEVEDQLACLRCIRRHLADDGRFILDLFNPSLPIMAREVTGEEQGDEPEFTMPDGRRVLRRNRIVARDVFKQYHDVELIYTRPIPMAAPSASFMPSRCATSSATKPSTCWRAAGLPWRRCTPITTRVPYGSNYPGELIFVARKG